MSEAYLYPLFFEPIYQYRLWGGRKLADILSAPMPNGPIGEAWILSDRDDDASVVSNGELKGRTIRQLMTQFPTQLMGSLASHFSRFPLLLKFLNAREMLSVQVHPSGKMAKTEGWVVLEAGADSRIYAGLKSGTTKENLQSAVTDGKVEDHLVGFTPKCGDAVFIPAGTVHSLGGDIVVLEPQQNSDVTFRLYDWNHIDPNTGQLRPLQVADALACINFQQGEIGPVVPVVEGIGSVTRERLFVAPPFSLWRIKSASNFVVGSSLTPHVIVCIEGSGLLQHASVQYPVKKGNVVLLPAQVGICTFHPKNPVNLIEIAL
jgi:mannose-6-phosphate isomerase